MGPFFPFCPCVSVLQYRVTEAERFRTACTKSRDGGTCEKWTCFENEVYRCHGVSVWKQSSSDAGKPAQPLSLIPLLLSFPSACTHQQRRLQLAMPDHMQLTKQLTAVPPLWTQHKTTDLTDVFVPGSQVMAYLNRWAVTYWHPVRTVIISHPSKLMSRESLSITCREDLADGSASCIWYVVSSRAESLLKPSKQSTSWGNESCFNNGFICLSFS